MSVAFDHYRMNTVPQESTTLPPESPLAMPTQSLRGETLSRRWLPTSPARIGQRRALVMGGALLLTAIGTWQMHLALSSGGLLLLEAVLLGLFTALFAWIAFGFTTTLAGFFLVISRREVNSPEDLHLNEPPPKLRTRTALLMPIYNEDAQRLMAGLQAICESLDSTGRLRHFDFFVLSDTRKPELVQAEEAAFNALRERLGPDARVYYRHREENLGRKAGNIAEWVRRFGGAYEHMLILDADSLMSGRTLVRLASAMERHPRVALIQTLPLIVNGRSVFARMQQFAGRVYGPVMAYGHAWWMGAESNYWGHNAIIRTRAFAAHAGLPELGGQRPFSGSVLSHDFVEAALMRRGGWALHLAPGLSGSYEEGPPSLTDMLIRDRRWAQGNLQHGGVIGADGLHPVSRMHLLMGIGNYLTAPAWAMLMLVGLAIPLQARLTGESMLLAGVETQRFLGVFGVTVLVLLLPKFLGYLATLSYTRLRRGCGGTWRCLLSMVLETASASLLAPITMYVQSRGTASILAGEDSGWEAQRRDDGSVPLAGLARRYGGVTGFGLLFAGIAWFVSPQMMLWMLPVLVGMVFSVPIVALTSSNTLGQWLRQRHLLQTPEEIQPPPVLARASQLRRELASAGQ